MKRLTSTGRPTRFVHVMLGVAILAAMSGSWLAPVPVRAQEDKRAAALSWDDAPIVPRHRSQADWLVDVGWKSYGEMYGPFPTREYTEGDTEQFIPLGGQADAPRTFSLAQRTAHAYFWFERGVQPDRTTLERTTRFFEEHIWPLNHSIYGSESNPGIDGDSRIHILSQTHIGPRIMGAFNPEDQCPRTVCPASNQREIIYIGLDAAPLGSPEYLTTLAHEHQHLIQFHVDGNERRWFNEGLSQLAEHLNGFAPHTIGDYNVIDFLKAPDHPLNDWPAGASDVRRYYGASYLFMVYLYERFGLEFIRYLTGTDYDGLAAIQHALAATDQRVSVDEVFGDWMLANYLDDPYVGDGRYYYQSLDLPGQIQPAPLKLAHGHAQHADTVSQYGADYLILDEPGTYRLTFDGSDRTEVVGAAPRSENWMWWSYDGSSSAARLTGTFDLRELDTATLAFSAWWNVEDEYDWFQVLVSDNGGRDWTIVSGERAAPPGAKAPGAHYSGRSNTWVDERIDLSEYAGRKVLVRFEYLTDETRTLPGVALDDIGILELGDLDGAEDAASPWTPEGFLRIPDSVAQQWAVAVVIQAPGAHPTIEWVTLDPANIGLATLTVPQGGSATLAIGATAPFTTNRASYKLCVQRTS